MQFGIINSMREKLSNPSGLSLGFRLFLLLIFVFGAFLFKLNDFAKSAAGDVTLTASAFSDTDAEDTFNASQWVIRDSGSTVYDQVAGAVTSITVSGSTFTNGTTYFWKVRYQDQHTVWSDYSAESSFVYNDGGATPTPGASTAAPSGTATVSGTSTSTASSTTSSTATASATVSASATVTASCMFGWQDWDGDGIAESCGDPQPINIIYVPEDQVDFCAGSKVKITYYFRKTYVNGGAEETLEGYQALADLTTGDGGPVHDLYLSLDGGSVYTRIAEDFDPMPGASISKLPSPLKSIASSVRFNYKDVNFLKVTKYFDIPSNMISDPSKARFLVYVRNQGEYHEIPDDYPGIVLDSGGRDLGDSFVAPNLSDAGTYAYYSGPSSSGDVMDITNSIQSKDCDLTASSPVPPGAPTCDYDFVTPIKGETFQTLRISEIIWKALGGSQTQTTIPGITATASSTVTSSSPKANLYLSKNGGSTYQGIASDLTGTSYSHYFSNTDATTRAKLRIDHVNQAGEIISTCYSDLFKIAGNGGVGGTGLFGTIPRTTSSLLVLGSLLASILSFLLTAVASIPFLQRLANTLFALFAPPAWPGKKPSWGFVYDSISKRPLKDVVLRIFAEPSGRLRSSVKSNINGAFGFILPPGKYSLIASLMGYDFPSKLIIGNTDGKFLSVYKGGDLDVIGDGQQKAQVNINVPLDRTTMSTFDVIQVRTLATISRFFQTIRLPIMILGTIAAVYLLVKDHRTVDYIIGALYVVLWAIEIRNMLKKKAFGMVRDTAGNPLFMALVRVLDSRGRLKLTVATGDDGKFQLFLDPGVYRLDVSRGGYRSIRTELFKIDKIQDIGRLDLRLQKL